MYISIELRIKASPSWNIYWIIAIIGNHNKYIDIPNPLLIQNNNIIIQEIKKLTRQLVTEDIGRIILGKYTFLIILALNNTEFNPILIELVKKVHGIIPVIKYIR